ncbi:SMP-30/gluconolactonase/LRE family protein [Nocardiopsis sp. CNS-639]|uniref:SMP-30/gluconolactonase/LRE family protein n=1 Tax=Nocardiopsis sp. CNS-639 TaxID=1169153 RepID=UPI000382DAEF|nr:SMP-30/gluconolactonase/LRE family protein [Nocardiopsis sp. CNS-639]
MTSVATAVPASEGRYALGEGPVWDSARDRLLWVDITAGEIIEGRLDPDSGRITATGVHRFEGTVGAVATSADGDLIVAERSTLTRVRADGRRTGIARVLDSGADSRLNDGAVDPAGRFLVGSLADDDRTGEEVLARLGADGPVLLDTDLNLSNGLAWSPRGTRFYSIDTVPGTVWGRDYDPATGATGPRERLFTVEDGFPDGMCVDAEGNLWIAVWGRGRIERRAPGGEVLSTVAVDAPHTSSVTFAGPDLDILVITTATHDLSPRDLDESPDSGRLFTARPGVRGLPTPYWVPSTP